MNQHQRMAIFDADPQRLRTAAMVAFMRMNATMVSVEDEESPHGPLAAITEPSIWSIGERITIRFGDHGSALIESNSRQWLTLFDWFVNRRNVHRVEKLMRQYLDHPSRHDNPSPNQSGT